MKGDDEKEEEDMEIAYKVVVVVVEDGKRMKRLSCQGTGKELLAVDSWWGYGEMLLDGQRCPRMQRAVYQAGEDPLACPLAAIKCY